MQIKKRVHGSRAWGRQRWGGERRGDIWGAEAICGDIFTPLLIFNTSSRAHLSPFLLTSLVLLGAAASAAPNTRVFVCFSFVVRYTRPDHKWWKINPRRRTVWGIKSLRVVSSDVMPPRVPVSLNLWSSPLNLPTYHPADNVLCAIQMVFCCESCYISAPQTTAPEKHQAVLLQCCKSLSCFMLEPGKKQSLIR